MTLKVRMCRACFSRGARIGFTPRAWRNEEERLAMIEAGDLEVNTYWCEGRSPPEATIERWKANTDWDDPESVEEFNSNMEYWNTEAHEWTVTETTQQYEDRRDAELAERLASTTRSWRWSLLD
jgi:hypothetical protein